MSSARDFQVFEVNYEKHPNILTDTGFPLDLGGNELFDVAAHKGRVFWQGCCQISEIECQHQTLRRMCVV